jgi:hypothetical protein
MCRERGLSQIPLNKPAKQKIINREYWAEKRGQDRLNRKNEAIRSVGGKPTESKFKTELARIRQAIDETKQKCNSAEDFKATLKREHNIVVSESRGRWSYLPEYRKRPITSRRLGADYSKESIEAFITQRLLELQQQQAVALMKRLDNCGRFGFPVFVVLDEDGEVIHIQDSSFLEEGQGYSQEKVLRFFKNWTPKAVRP